MTVLRRPSSFQVSVLSLVLGSVGVVSLLGCGGGGGSVSSTPPPTSTITSVTVSPSTANLIVKAPQQFTATVQGTGAFNAAVTWLVNNVPGGNSSVGTITSPGLYTAPSSVPSPNSVTVTAQSVQDSTKSGAAAVTINPENVKVNVSPPSGSAQLGATLQFTATVTGTVNTAVFWSVNTFVGGQTSVGFIDGKGDYTAPLNLPPNNQVTVTATSQEDTTKSASATVTILATASGITVIISPQNPSVVFDGSQSIQFTASVSGTSNTAVTWSVDSFSYPTIGQISSTGLFTPLAFNCTNVPPTGAIRAVSAANAGAQGVSLVHLVPPRPVITGLSPQPVDAESLLQLTGTFALGAGLTVLYPGPNGTSIPGGITGIASNAVSGPVPLGAASGPLSLQQTCVSGLTGFQYPSQESNALPFVRLPRLRIRANREVLTPGESTQMLTAFLGDPTPQPITWSAVFGTVTSAGVFTAGSSNWDKVTGCITGTQQCDFFVFSVVPARIDPTVAVVPTGGTIQLSEVQGSSTLSPTWSITAGGGTMSPSGLYTAATTLQDTGAIPITATATVGSATNAIGVVGGFPGMVNRIIDYPDISANASGTTTLPSTITVDGHSVYVFSDNLPFIVANGHYKWIDVYDATDSVHPVWTGAVEGFDQDLDIQPMRTFASGGFLWRVTAPQAITLAGSPTTEVAFYSSSGGQPVLQQFFTVPRLWTYNFYKGLLIGIASSFSSTGQDLWPQVAAQVFDGRTGTVNVSQIPLVIQNPAVPVSVGGIYATDTRLFLLYQQQQSDGSMPFFLSTYDLTTSPPTLLQTVVSSGGPATPPGGDPPPVFGNLLFTGAGIYDVSSGLPVLVAPFEGLPTDMSGPLALEGPLIWGGYNLVDYSDPANPIIQGLLYNGDDPTLGRARLVGNKAYILGSGLQIFDLTAHKGGLIPKASLPRNGTILDLLVSSSDLYVADAGGFVTTYDLTRTPPQQISSFVLGSGTPLSFAAVGQFLFVGTSTELLVLDVSNPSSPAKAASLPLPTSSLALVGNALYAGTTNNQLVAINVANPASPVAGVPLTIAGFPVGMQASGTLLFIAADKAGLLTYSIANPLLPTFLSQFQPSSAVEGVAIDGNLALLAAADGGFVIADVTNPAVPVAAGQFPLGLLTCFASLDPADGTPALVSIALNNGIAFLGSANMYGRVFGFDYRQPASPRVVSAAAYGNAILESVQALAFSASAMFVGGDMFFAVDNTQPRNFIRHMCLPPPFGSSAVATFPEMQKSSSRLSIWNPKTHFARNRQLHP